jgi:MFS family permease
MDTAIQKTVDGSTKKSVAILDAIGSMRAFLLIWFGQVISVIGSSMTGFALGVYVYQRTSSASVFALILLFNMLPRALFSPLAGVVADRWDRRRIMILSDGGAAISTLAVASLLIAGRLEVWHIFLATFLNSTLSTMQGPAFAAAVTQLVPKAQFGRVNGLMQLGSGVGQMVAPVLAGALIGLAGLRAVLIVDLATFLFAVGTLLATQFPQLKSTSDKVGQKRSLISDLRAGWRYIVARPGLVALLVVFAVANYLVGNAEAVLTPMILSFASPGTLGVILTLGGFGMLVGSLVLSVWGGGRQRVYTALGFYALLGLAVIAAGLSPSAPLVAGALFVTFLCVPIAIGSAHAILQTKVDPGMQGRVFALRMTLNTGAFALAYVTGGPLVDLIFEPLMAQGGPLAGSVGQLIGVGPGRGMGLMFIVMGFLAVLTAVGGLLYSRLRRVELELPDAVQG